MSPLHSSGSPTVGVENQIRNCYLTRTFRVPKDGQKWYVSFAFPAIRSAKRSEKVQKWLPQLCPFVVP